MTKILNSFNEYLLNISVSGTVQSAGGSRYFLTVSRTSLMVQRLSICLPMQETQVQSLVQENSIYDGGAKPVCHHC